jgi:hypothetical protein
MAFVAKLPVEFDLLPDCGIVFSERVRDRSFRGAVADSDFDNLSFLEGKVGVCVCFCHGITSFGEGIAGQGDYASLYE